MIRGSLTEADLACLRGYTQTISKFIVTDSDKDNKARISPSAFVRLARCLHPNMSLLPYLSDLVIVDADESIAYLDLLLTPSLESLEASCIPDAQQSTFYSFLTAIEQEVPLLQTLILGPGRFLPRSLQTISQFNSLRHLELKHEDSKLPFAFFDNIGSLAMLKTFILDARYVSGCLTGDEPIVFPPFPSDDFPNSNAMDGNHSEPQGAADVRHSKTFNQLAKLHVTGWLPLLEDLIHRVTSTKLEDVSVTFVRLSYDELKVSLAREKAEKERKAEEVRMREELEMKMKEQEKMLKDEMERKRIDEERRWREEAEKKKKEQEELWDGVNVFYCEPTAPTEVEPRFTANSSGRKKTKMGGKASPVPSFGCDAPWGVGGFPCETMPPKVERPSIATSKQDAAKQQGKVREMLLKEQERLASLSFEALTESFTKILRKLCLTSLKSLSVCQLDGFFQCLLNHSTLPKEMFRTMLLLPAIESLEVKGWILDSVEDVLSAAEPIPNLKCLLLPLGEPNSSISLPTLRHIAKTFPKLEPFQCYIDSHSPVPEYSIPTDVGLSHGLQILSVGSSFPPPPVDKKLEYLIARHLYLLFPKLESVRTSEEHDAELWVIVDEFVKMFQTARMDDLNRQ